MRKLERREAVADAVLRIVARDGLDAVTAPAVAAEAGRSRESVSRELATEELLLRLTLTHSIDVLDRRIALAGGDFGLLGSLAEQRQPDLAGHRTWLAFLARAAAGPDLGDPVRRRFGAAHRGVREGLADAGPGRGHEARTTAALVDGLTAHVLIGACSRREATDALAAHLAR